MSPGIAQEAEVEDTIIRPNFPVFICGKEAASGEKVRHDPVCAAAGLWPGITMSGGWQHVSCVINM